VGKVFFPQLQRKVVNMTVALTSPVTGGAQTGFTAPTYTIVLDTALDTNGKQYAVTALGGTQAGVRVHSVSDPFTFLYVKPKTFKPLGIPHPVTGRLQSVPKNTHLIKIAKGAIPLAGQPSSVMTVRCLLEVPAGSDVADPANLRAAISLLVGALTQISSGAGDTLVTGIL
jgi:hypothetical protein